MSSVGFTVDNDLIRTPQELYYNRFKITLQSHLSLSLHFHRDNALLLCRLSASPQQHVAFICQLQNGVVISRQTAYTPHWNERKLEYVMWCQNTAQANKQLDTMKRAT